LNCAAVKSAIDNDEFSDRFIESSEQARGFDGQARPAFFCNGITADWQSAAREFKA